MNSAQISTSVPTHAHPDLYNNLVKDVSHQIAIAGTTKVISSGAITVNPAAGEGYYRVETESSAAFDYLDTINGGVNGDIICIHQFTYDHQVILRHVTGNIVLPDQRDIFLSGYSNVNLRFNGTYWYVITDAKMDDFTPNNMAFLALTNAYQDLLPAPTYGIYRVGTIVLVNEDVSAGTDFYFKLVKAGVDYTPVQISLSPYDRLILSFPFVLDSTIKIQAKLGATLSGRATISYGRWYGSSALLNFTNYAWTTVFTATQKTHLDGVCIVNTDTVQQILRILIVDLSGQVFYTIKTLKAGYTWILDLDTVLNTGAIVQVMAGGAGLVGSVCLSLREVS